MDFDNRGMSNKPYNETQAAFAASLEEALKKAGVEGNALTGWGKIPADQGNFVQDGPPKFWNPRRQNKVVFFFHRREPKLRLYLSFTLEEATRWTPTLKVSYLMTCSDGAKDLLTEQQVDMPLPAVENAIKQFVASAR